MESKRRSPMMKFHHFFEKIFRAAKNGQTTEELGRLFAKRELAR